MTKFSHTILAGLAVCAAVLAIAACGSSGGGANNGWTSAKISQAKQKINSAINSSISTVTASLPAADKTKLKNLLNTYVNCAMNVIEPKATPDQAFSDTWSGAQSLENTVKTKCQGPLQKGAESLAGSAGS